MAVVQKPLVVFASGYWARCIKEFPIFKNKEGLKRKKLTLSLTVQIREAYPEITTDIWTNDYPASEVIPLSYEPTHPLIFIVCGVKCEQTNYRERLSELFEAIKIYEKNEQTHLTQIVFLQELNDELSGAKEKLAKRAATLMKIIGQKKEKVNEGTSTEGEDTSG